VDISSKEVVDGLFLIACMALRMDCLHKDSICADRDNPTASSC
jgi:hypothetical protein